jgi:glycosyltransferase involved in cell wall biosynthesis
MQVGNLSPTKGTDIAILMMAELRRRLGPACPALDLYGRGSSENFFREMATVLELDGLVRFHGLQPGILQRCGSGNVLLVASREETGPLVAAEAMSRGIPVVTSDVGEVRDMLPDHRYGRIAPVSSIIGLADAAQALLSDLAAGKIDPGLLIERHRSCYTSELMAERTEEIYRRLLDRPPPFGREPTSLSVRRA